jgi:hypothetical protein
MREREIKLKKKKKTVPFPPTGIKLSSPKYATRFAVVSH